MVSFPLSANQPFGWFGLALWLEVVSQPVAQHLWNLLYRRIEFCGTLNIAGVLQLLESLPNAFATIGGL
ncbi:MAG: hypothetical protein DME26_22535 [Verrucomicrobia bacterium]|nr:MAG: hypothetical protein DME26_22535 [Verrucomicrobiota bacterium]